MSPPHVLILGGGFGGLYAARALARAPVRVTIVDRRNHHLFQPLLYQVATAALAAPDIAAPIRAILARQDNATVLLAEATAIDPAARRVTTDEGDLDYDYLIVATGSTHSYFGHDAWAPFAPGLKDIEDAFEIRSRILLAFERAEATRDDASRRAWLTFVVVGGGPTGVELAGAIAEIAQKTLARNFRNFNPRDARIVLVDGSDRVLPTFPPESSRDAHRLLERKGVEILLGALATGIDAAGVDLAGVGRIEARTVLWAAGVAMSPLARGLGAPLDRHGRVLVGPDLSLPAHPEVFVIGDLAAVEQKGEFLPGVAQPAIQEGRAAARNIVRRVRGEPTVPFRYKDLGTMATIGRSAAVAIVFGRRFSGFLAWLLWLFIHITWLIGYRNRLLVLLEWTWAYVTWGRGARVILDRNASLPSATALACILALTAALGSFAGCESDSTAPPFPPPQLRVDDAPAWSHDGTRVAFATGQRIRVTTAAGPPSTHFGPRWLDSSRILYDQRAANGDVRSFVVDRTTGVVVEVPGGLGGSEAISASRDSVLIEEYDRSDPALSKIVLFVRGLTSPQATARQVTSYEPVPSAPADGLR